MYSDTPVPAPTPESEAQLRREIVRAQWQQQRNNAREDKPCES